MQILAKAGSVLLSVLALSVLILVHEFGHFGMARIFKIPVYEFSVGMGPCLWQRKRGETKYSVRAIPMGGYCAFDDDASLNSGDLNLYKYPVWKRFLVVFAGPLMNVFIGFVISVLIVACIGISTVVPVVSTVQEGSPAAEGGIQPGDTFLSVNDVEVNGDRDVLADALNENGGNTAVIVVERDGEEVTLDLTPEYDEENARYMVGVYLETVYVPQPLGYSVQRAAEWNVEMVKEIFEFLAGLVTRGEGASDMTGVVGTVAIMSDTVQTGTAAEMLTLIAFISINLGVFNLIPLPALDGGKLLLYLVEAVIRKHLTIKQETVVQTIGLVFFGLLFVVILVHDIIRIAQGVF